MKRHKIATSCKGKDKEFKARTVWLAKNGYKFDINNHYWINFKSKEKAIVDMERFLKWPNWAVFIGPEQL